MSEAAVVPKPELQQGSLGDKSKVLLLTLLVPCSAEGFVVLFFYSIIGPHRTHKRNVFRG